MVSDAINLTISATSRRRYSRPQACSIFAIPPDFPPEHVPHQTGLIVADRYGGEIVKEAEVQSLHASRRKAMTISFARCSAERLSRHLDGVQDIKGGETKWGRCRLAWYRPFSWPLRPGPLPARRRFHNW
jgi:hypothetical protein